MTSPSGGQEVVAPNQSASADGRGPVAILDQVLWRDLLSAESADAFGAAWLNLACRVIAGASSGVLILRQDAAPPRLVAAWPAEGVPDPVLVASAQHAMQEGRGVVQPPPAGSGQKLRAAYLSDPARHQRGRRRRARCRPWCRP